MTNPRFPLYVVSYSRYDNCKTANALDEMDVPYHLVIEPEELDEYSERFGGSNILSVPEEYHDEYDTYDGLGQEKSQGPGPARNYAWNHAIENGYDWHWVMDDNINHFARFHDNSQIKFGDGSIFRLMEDFVSQYKNIGMAGPRYRGFVYQRLQQPPLIFNTRIYSCNLIRNDVPFRWAGRYNEDTDLSLRMLKNDWCTVLFTAFLQDKAGTQTMDGGNTENFYADEGTYLKSKMLKQQHPIVTELTFSDGRWNRPHHKVDYSPFQKNELKRKDDPPEVGEYNFRLREKE